MDKYILKKNYLLISFVTLCLLQVSCQPNLPLGWQKYNYISPKINFTARQMVSFGEDIWIQATKNDGNIWRPLLLRFSIQTQTLKSYQVELQGGTLVPQKLFISGKGELWGAGLQYNSPDYMNRLNMNCQINISNWLLIRYLPNDDRFEIVQDKDKILRGCRLIAIAEDGEGNLWLPIITGSNYYIFRYNPTTNEAVEVDLPRILSISSASVVEIQNILGGPDGALWISVIKSEKNSGIKTSSILRYDPKNGGVTDFGHPSTDDRGIAVCFDSFGHLWISSIAWLNWDAETPTWHKEAKALFFAKTEPDRQSEFTQPSQIFQSSDGKIWFVLTYQKGLAVFDYGKNIWEKVSFGENVTENGIIFDISSSITENNGYLWVIENGNFYRLKVRE